MQALLFLPARAGNFRVECESGAVLNIDTAALALPGEPVSGPHHLLVLENVAVEAQAYAKFEDPARPNAARWLLTSAIVKLAYEN